MLKILEVDRQWRVTYHLNYLVSIFYYFYDAFDELPNVGETKKLKTKSGAIEISRQGLVVEQGWCLVGMVLKTL